MYKTKVCTFSYATLIELLEAFNSAIWLKPSNEEYQPQPYDVESSFPKTDLKFFMKT